ncbi:MAG: class I SAM-dependent methyltransferase [Leptolyngbya sp. SIO3F4]|nr:class I SAM-dependent methyltransferase [Leptolyngbya sp. SIO3F4]
MSQPFSQYDARNYPTADIITGYRQWAPVYDQTIYNELDLPLLERQQTITWSQIQRAADLGCGTGRIGQWLIHQGVKAIDGVDCSEAMLKVAIAKHIYTTWHIAEMTRTPLPTNAYNLVITSLALCHLSKLADFYQEADRLLSNGGFCVVIDYHPFFLIQGIPTHFETPSGESIAIHNTVHLHSDHIQQGRQVNFQLLDMQERLVDLPWINKRPNMAKYQHQPISFCMVWQKNISS